MGAVGKAEREHYFFIDSLRAAACFLVVFHHTLTYFPGPFAAFYVQYLKPFFPTVTLYLLVSGFVHAAVIGSKVQSYGRYVWDKFNRIMVPYFTISLLTLGLRLFAERSHVIALGEIQYTPFAWDQAGLRVLFSGVEGHYYFLELLFVYLLIFPFLVRRLNTPLKALVAFLILLAVDFHFATGYSRLQSPIWSPVALLGAMLAGFKFFLFGFVLNRFYTASKDFLEEHGVLVGAVSLFAFAFLHWDAPQYNEYWVLIELFGYFSLGRALLSAPIAVVSQVSALSFGIYLLHQPYFLKFSRLTLSPLSDVPGVQLFCTWLLTCVLTTLAAKALDGNRFTARFLLGKKPSKKTDFGFLPVELPRGECAGSGA